MDSGYVGTERSFEKKGDEGENMRTRFSRASSDKGAAEKESQEDSHLLSSGNRSTRERMVRDLSAFCSFKDSKV